MSLIARMIRERTHGEPPDRASFGGSDDKWDGYLLGVEEAGAVAADLHQGAVAENEKLREALTGLMHESRVWLEPPGMRANPAMSAARTALGGQ